MIESKKQWISERTISVEEQKKLENLINTVMKNSQQLEKDVQMKQEVIESSGLPELYDELQDYIEFRKNIKIDIFQELQNDMNELYEKLKIDKWNKDNFIEQQGQINTYLEKCDKLKKYQYFEQDLEGIQNIQKIIQQLGNVVQKNYLSVQQTRSKSMPLAELSDKQGLIYYFNYLANLFEFLVPNEGSIEFLHQLQISQKNYTFYLIQSDEQFMSLIVKKQDQYLLYCKSNIRPTLIQQVEGLDHQMNIDEHVFLPKEDQYSKIYDTLKCQLVLVGLIEDKKQVNFQKMLENMKIFQNYQSARSILDCFEFMNQFGFTIK